MRSTAASASAASPRGTRSSSGSARPSGSSGPPSGRAFLVTSWTSRLLPSDLLIFSPPMVTHALCIHIDVKRQPGRARLRLLVLVVGEAQVDAATVDVERVAEVLAGHRGALEVPAGAAASPRRRPARGLGLVGLAALPEGEVARVALAARVGVLGRGHVVDLLVRQLPRMPATTGRRSRRHPSRPAQRRHDPGR